MEERKLWLEAEKKFRYDSNSLVTCPNCKKGNLFITDIAFNEKDISCGGERCIKCTNCEKFEIVLYRNSVPENWYSKNLGL
ncbi:hypothetical protein [Flavobacterium quisquiliarum]|jgi:hypothetical protein|uniref:Uncharacterized protein n=1 Tax=Flavobacterium quisquiliarum TaxID=1834436 RepID=A0ABV8W9K3_9FLAO|nr:hypothetical protein [Flavobacterium quisquiliarum]MBW1656235.1 hypothetical protein [Flavobacterium quisquiliarum]NWL02078.1 hypothetical protein [Flavobacterium collinsii]